jgi:hypothetical protein
VRRGTKEIKGIGHFSKINPYEKKHKVEMSKGWPVQPGTELQNSTPQGRKSYAKRKKAREDEQFHPNGVCVRSLSRSFGSTVSLRFGSFITSQIAEKHEAEKECYPGFLIRNAPKMFIIRHQKRGGRPKGKRRCGCKLDRPHAFGFLVFWF